LKFIAPRGWLKQSQRDAAIGFDESISCDLQDHRIAIGVARDARFRTDHTFR
jgi:hypothetical protein